jgi:hypothetical protein
MRIGLTRGMRRVGWLRARSNRISIAILQSICDRVGEGGGKETEGGPRYDVHDVSRVYCPWLCLGRAMAPDASRLTLGCCLTFKAPSSRCRAGCICRYSSGLVAGTGSSVASLSLTISLRPHVWNPPQTTPSGYSILPFDSLPRLSPTHLPQAARYPAGPSRLVGELTFAVLPQGEEL